MYKLFKKIGRDERFNKSTDQGVASMVEERRGEKGEEERKEGRRSIIHL